MVKPLNKEWELFGHKYRVAGAKGEKVDCKACQKQVSAAVNRLQSHMRVCPARFSLAAALLNSSRTNSSSSAGSSGTGLSDAIPTTSELIEQAIEAGTLATEHATATNVNATESSAPPAKKRRPSTTAKIRDRPRWNASAASSINVDDLWLHSVVGETTTAASTTTASFNKRRLDIEEKRLQLEIKRNLREERRERLSLVIMEAQARKEKLLAEKVGYEAKVLLALSRKQVRDQGVSEEEIDRILPILSSQSSPDNRINGTSITATNEATTFTRITNELLGEKDATTEANNAGEDDAEGY